jgi:hypothetical protein
LGALLMAAAPLAAASEQPAAAPCLAIEGDAILAGDLARVNPVFRALDASLAMGAAPMPGARRVFRAVELARLVRVNHLPSGPLREVCFEWPTAVLSPGKLAQAMAGVLDCDASAIEVIEQSRLPAPPGDLVFAKRDLDPVPGSDGRVLVWRGFVRYGVGRSFPVWARIRVPPALTVMAAPEVQAGKEVQVEVRNGSMRIRMVAKAERSGRIGETVPLINPASSAHFRARVDGKDLVVVTVERQ